MIYLFYICLFYFIFLAGSVYVYSLQHYVINKLVKYFRQLGVIIQEYPMLPLPIKVVRHVIIYMQGTCDNRTWIICIYSPKCTYLWVLTCLLKIMQQTIILIIFPMVGAMVFSATSAMSWRSVLLVEENGVPRENHQHVASH